MSQHALELGMLQDLIASATCQQIHPCLNQLGDHDGITILSVQTNQSHLYAESKVRQVGVLA
jgi:hypothetical protein